jgi:copper chaperone NosL
MNRRMFLTGLLALTQCKPDRQDAALPAPREITDASVGQFCGMSLTEHAGPKGQLFVRELPDPYWFATVRDMFAFAMLPEMPKAITAIYVSDMARARDWSQPEPGMWIEAHQALYVIGSRRGSGMQTAEAIPFGQDEAARSFIRANGGRIVRFADMPRDYILMAAEEPG